MNHATTTTTTGIDMERAQWEAIRSKEIERSRKEMTESNVDTTIETSTTSTRRSFNNNSSSTKTPMSHQVAMFIGSSPFINNTDGSEVGGVITSSAPIETSLKVNGRKNTLTRSSSSYRSSFTSSNDTRNGGIDYIYDADVDSTIQGDLRELKIKAEDGLQTIMNRTTDFFLWAKQRSLDEIDKISTRPSNLPPKDPEEERAQRALFSQILKREADREAELIRAKERREDAMRTASQVWHKEILPQWKTKYNTRKTRELWWHGLPSSVRGHIWFLAMKNDLHITNELFQIFLGHARTKVADAEANSRSLNNKFGPSEYEGDLASEGTFGRNNGSSVRSHSDNGNGGYDNATGIGRRILGKEDSIQLISLDLSRTFPQLGIFQNGGPYNEKLRNVLEAYVCYRPDVGYLQGMSFVASMLLLNLSVFNTFVVFANILNKPFHMSFFRMTVPQMRPYLLAFSSLFLEFIPQLHTRFSELSVSSSMFVVEWFLTMFSKALPLDLAMRVWDLYFLDGETVLFRTALGILRMYESNLMNESFEDIAQFLTHLPHDIDETRLFQAIQGVNLTQKRLSTEILDHMKWAQANPSTTLP